MSASVLIFKNKASTNKRHNKKKYIIISLHIFSKIKMTSKPKKKLKKHFNKIQK